MRKDTVRLYDENEHFSHHISEDRHNELIAAGIAGPHYDPMTNRYLGLKMYKPDPEESKGQLRESGPSPCYISAADMENNAAGAVDTAKRFKVYRLREEGQEVPASIRRYGKDRSGKPNPDLLGNTVDRAMSKVEAWAGASENNRSVTVTPAGIVGAVSV